MLSRLFNFRTLGIHETYLNQEWNTNDIEINLQHFIMMNSNQHILINKSFETIAMIETKSLNFYNSFKKIVANFQILKDKKTVDYFSELHKSKINVVLL